MPMPMSTFDKPHAPMPTNQPVAPLQTRARWADTSGGTLDIGTAPTPEQAEASQAASLRDVTVMMVDDEPMMTDVVQTYLEEAGYRRFVAVNDPHRALEVARKERPGVMLLDLMMPGLSGFDILQKMRDDEVLRYVPVIVLTAASNATTKLRALSLGASEFLAKPVDSSELVLRVRNSLVFKVYQDRLVNEDPLTDLPNRRVFVERLKASLERARGSGQMLGLLNVSIDRFKQVNDTLGHGAGDRLLAAVGQRLRACTRRSAATGGGRSEPLLLSRLGGDEFGVLLPQIAAPDAADRVARRVLAAMSQPFEHERKEFFITPSIGIAIFPDDGATDEVLLRNAGMAAAHAKRSGRNTYHFYSEALHTVSVDRLGLETQLYRAIEQQQLQLHYQPKVDFANGRVVGAEALLRWNHPTLGLVPPDRFIPIAEETGLIVSIGAWVIDQACEQIGAWVAHGLDDLKVAVNVSRHELVAGGLCEIVQSAMERHGVKAGQLVIELTESMLIDRVEETSRQLDRLREQGVLLSIDDFGTGYSSMAYLKRFRVHELKIDRSFIRGTPDDPTDCAIVRAIAVLAQSLNMTLVAEGVESEQQRDFLASIGCDMYQGFLYSRALPPEAFERKVMGAKSGRARNEVATESRRASPIHAAREEGL